MGYFQRDVDNVTVGDSGAIVAITDFKDRKGSKFGAVAGSRIAGGWPPTNIGGPAAFKTAPAGIITAPILADPTAKAVGVVITDPIAEFVAGTVRVALAGISAFIGGSAVLPCLALIIGSAAAGATVVSLADHPVAALLVTPAATDAAETFADFVGLALVIGVAAALAAPVFANFATGAGFITNTAAAASVIEFFARQTETLAGASIFSGRGAAAIGASGSQQDQEEGEGEDGSKMSSHGLWHPFVGRVSFYPVKIYVRLLSFLNLVGVESNQEFVCPSHITETPNADGIEGSGLDDIVEYKGTGLSRIPLPNLTGALNSSSKMCLHRHPWGSAVESGRHKAVCIGGE